MRATNQAEGTAREWYDAINETARCLGGPETLSTLEPRSLFESMGIPVEVDEDLSRLVWSLRHEASLSAVGTLLARIELLRSIRARAALSGSLSAEIPEGLESSLHGRRLVFIIGGPRSGTSGLFRYMAGWPGVRAPTTVEVLYPDLIDRHSEGNPEAIASVTTQDRLWDAIDPSFASQHLNRGDLPAECLPVLSASFLSHHWTGCYRIPTYEAHLQRSGSQRALAYHRAFVHRLAGAADEPILLFKSPAHALILPDLLHTYPDARFIFLDREPNSVLNSHAQLLSTLRNMRSERGDMGIDVRDAGNILRQTYIRLNEALISDELSARNFRVIRYEDLIVRLRAVSEELSAWLLIEPPIDAAETLTQRKLEQGSIAKQSRIAELDGETLDMRSEMLERATTLTIRP